MASCFVDLKEIQEFQWRVKIEEQTNLIKNHVISYIKF